MNQRQRKKRVKQQQANSTTDTNTNIVDARNEFLASVYTQATKSATNGPWANLYKTQNDYDSLEIADDIQSLRERSKMFYANDPYYRPIIDNLASNVVGDGFVYRSPDKDAEDRFYNWLETADESGLCGDDFVATAVRWLFIFGSVLIVRRNDKLVLVDPQRLGSFAGNAPSTYNGNPVIDGVEIDDFTRRPIAFHIVTHKETKRVLAEDCIFISNQKIPGQVRGEPLLAQVADLLEAKYQYTNAALLAAQIAAAISLVITTSDVTGIDENFGKQMNLKTPAVGYVPPDTKIEQIKSEQPVGNYSNFNGDIERQICTTVGLTPAALGNVETLNFSASKLSIEVARDTYRRWQRFFISYLMRPLWEICNPGIPVEFRGCGFRSYDRKADYEADAFARETKLESFGDILANRGIWIDEHIEKINKESELLDGMTINHSAGTQESKAEEDA